MSKKALIMLLLISPFAVSHVAAQRVSPHAVAMTDEERQWLRKSIEATPYAALVVHTKAEILSIPSARRGGESSDAMTDERHVYHVRVLETFRGATYANIRYQMIANKGNSLEINSRPYILTLCKDGNVFYWPGPGASIEATPETIAEARHLSQQLASTNGLKLSSHA